MTDKHDNYRNPRCACASRVNSFTLSQVILAISRSISVTFIAMIIGFHQSAQNISERDVPTRRRFRKLDIHLTSLRISEIGYSFEIRTAGHSEETVGPTDALVGPFYDRRRFYDVIFGFRYDSNSDLVEEHFLIGGSSSFILPLYITNDYLMSPEETECFTLSIFSPEAEESFTCEYEKDIFCEHQICILDSDG